MAEVRFPFSEKRRVEMALTGEPLRKEVPDSEAGFALRTVSGGVFMHAELYPANEGVQPL